MAGAVKRITVDLSGYPDLVVVYLGMRVNMLSGFKTLLGFGPKIQNSVSAKPEGLLLHEYLMVSLFPPHLAMRQYWRDFQSLETWARSEPHRAWWKQFLRDSGGTGFWHETYFMRGGIEAIFDDIHQPLGLSAFAPQREARGPMFSSRQRLGLAGDAPAPPAPELSWVSLFRFSISIAPSASAVATISNCTILLPDLFSPPPFRHQKNIASIFPRQHQSQNAVTSVDRAKEEVSDLVHGLDGQSNKHRRSPMSHHLDSPIARQDIRLDITDLYVFRGETGTVFVINVCHSIFGPIPAPGYHPEGMYEFKVDLNGDAIEDLTYRFKFNERDKQGRQTYSVSRLTGADAADPRAAGTIIAQGTTGESLSTATGLHVWAGKAGDPFWIEPDVLHAVGHAFQDGTTVSLSGWDPARAKNLFAGHTVYSIVLEVPDKELLAQAGSNRRIGAWAVSTLATDAGGWRSINRVGLPMIHPLFTQFNEDLGNRLNAGSPTDDLATHGPSVAKAIAGVIAAYGTADDPRAYGEKVARRFCPNILPYEVGTAAAFGFAEWNGRTLTDNAPDVMFSLAANTPIRLGIGRESVTSKPSKTFPYVPAAAIETRTAGA